MAKADHKTHPTGQPIYGIVAQLSAIVLKALTDMHKVQKKKKKASLTDDNTEVSTESLPG